MKKIIIAFFLLTMGSQLLAELIPEYPNILTIGKLGDKERIYITYKDGYVYKFIEKDLKRIPDESLKKTPKVSMYLSFEFYKYNEKFDKAPDEKDLKPENFETIAVGKWNYLIENIEDFIKYQIIKENLEIEIDKISLPPEKKLFGKKKIDLKILRPNKYKPNESIILNDFLKLFTDNWSNISLKFLINKNLISNLIKRRKS